jgi:hypothetical protein
VLARGEVTNPLSPSSPSSPPPPVPPPCPPPPPDPSRALAAAPDPPPRWPPRTPNPRIPCLAPAAVRRPGPHLRRDTVVPNQEGRAAVEGELLHRHSRANPLSSPLLRRAPSSLPFLSGDVARAGPQPSGPPPAGRQDPLRGPRVMLRYAGRELGRARRERCSAGRRELNRTGHECRTPLIARLRRPQAHWP